MIYRGLSSNQFFLREKLNACNIVYYMQWVSVSFLCKRALARSRLRAYIVRSIVTGCCLHSLNFCRCYYCCYFLFSATYNVAEWLGSSLSYHNKRVQISFWSTFQESEFLMLPMPACITFGKCLKTRARFDPKLVSEIE